MFTKVLKSSRAIHTANDRSPSLTLFGDERSPPVRCVQMTASMVGAPMKFHEIDLWKGDNRTDFYKKINPLLKVPALKVDDHVITDSHAMVIYLCEQFGGHQLYPEDAILRARVLQMMFFNSSTLFPIDSDIMSKYFATLKIDDTRIKDFYAALDYLEIQLSAYKWLVHDELTLGDLCCGVTVSTLQLLVPPAGRHVNVRRWLNDLKKMPCFTEINARGLQGLRQMLDIFEQGK